MLAVVVTGPPGVGKTSVLEALVDGLSDDDVAHAAIEVEALTAVHPALTGAQWSQQLSAACAFYRDIGHRVLLIVETLETAADVAQLRLAVAADEMFLVRLDAEPRTVAERVLARESVSWSGRDALAEHARELAVSMRGLPDVDLVVRTDDRDADAAAEEIRSACSALRRR